MKFAVVSLVLGTISQYEMRKSLKIKLLIIHNLF